MYDIDDSTTTKRGLLRWAALFLGELRDGLTMINMQSAFLIVSKNYTEKQAGVLFFGTYEVFHKHSMILIIISNSYFYFQCLV